MILLWSAEIQPSYLQQFPKGSERTLTYKTDEMSFQNSLTKRWNGEDSKTDATQTSWIFLVLFDFFLSIVLSFFLLVSFFFSVFLSLFPSSLLSFFLFPFLCFSFFLSLSPFPLSLCEDCFYYCSKRNNVVVLFGTLKVQFFMLTEVRDCDLLIVVTSSTFLKRKDMLKEKNS